MADDVVTFKVPQSVKKSILTIDTFLGCDFTNSASAVSEFHSPNCVNLIRDVPGKVRKCMGYETVKSFSHNYLDSSEYETYNASGYTITPNEEGNGFHINGTSESFASITISQALTSFLLNPEYEYVFKIESTDNSLEVNFERNNWYTDIVTDGYTFTLNDINNHYVSIMFRGEIDADIKIGVYRSDKVPSHIEKSYDEGEMNINGYHTFHGKNPLLHAGAYMIANDTVLYSDANNHRSKSWQFEDKVAIADGKALLIYDGTTISKASDVAYVPTLTISKDPSGGGTDYEPLNLLQAGFIELFTGTADATQYHLSFGGLDDKAIKVEILDGNGSWQEKTLTTDYTVDRTTGIVTFVTAPGVSPITGEDNVKITAYRTVEGYADKVNKCSIGIQYGVNGATDRLFLTGNPDFINYDWYSGQNDPTYFPDTGYSKLGSGRSKIVGYSIISSQLATHKDENEEHQTIILRNGSLVDNEAAFRITNTLQGAGSIAPYSFNYLSNEPLFLTRLGIYAVTAQDVTGEKYAQNRSFYLNGKMLKEDNLEDAFACVYNDMYWLCINDKLYILDGLQPLATDKSLPYSNRQYVGFYRTNVPANVMWVADGEFYFGTKDGRVCRFYSDEEAPVSYNDDGEPIEAIWETPDLDGKLFYKNKTFKYMAVRLKSAVATSLKIYAMKRGIWSFLKEDGSSARYFAFSKIIFSKFTFSTDITQKLITTKLRIKKVDSARFRLVNDALNEPLGLYNIALEYVENGNYKG